MANKNSNSKQKHYVPELEQLLRYRNEMVIARFRKQFGLSRSESDVIWLDMLRFLWVTGRGRQTGVKVGLLATMAIVDEMWHAFVLHTREYTEFGHKYFKQFLHHAPNAEKEARRTLRQRIKQGEENRRLVEFVWKELGPEVARRWYHTYPAKFTKQEICRLQLKAAA